MVDNFDNVDDDDDGHHGDDDDDGNGDDEEDEDEERTRTRTMMMMMVMMIGSRSFQGTLCRNFWPKSRVYLARVQTYSETLVPT